MDEELRRLERLAAQGDQEALRSFIFRKYAIGDFELEDLDPKVRLNLAVELSRSLPESDRLEIYLRGDPSYNSEHNAHDICPNGHPVSSTNTPSGTTYHELSWNSYSLFRPEDPGMPLAVFYDDREENVQVGNLYCSICGISWAPDPHLIEGS